MIILYILIGIAVIGLIKNLISTVIQSAGDKMLPKWNGEYVRNSLTNKCHKVYTYGKWAGKSSGTCIRNIGRRYEKKNKRK